MVINAHGNLVQVLLSFLLTAFMLVALVTAYYLAVYEPELDPFRLGHRQHLKCNIPNPVDREFLHVARKLLHAIYRIFRLEALPIPWHMDGLSLEYSLYKVG